jgi:putative methyltransferase (TIGR04325 family)
MSIKREILDRAGSLPLVRVLAMMAYERHFARRSGGERLFRGIYANFARAAASAPKHSLFGHDHPAYASGVFHSPGRPLPSDYPVIFWLSRILHPTARLFDWGGNIGISYYAYRPYLDIPDSVEWIVNDVPSVVELGQKLKPARDGSGVSFTTSLTPLVSCDIMLAAGSLQVIEDPFAPLRTLARLPRHLLINKTPVYDRPSAVTLLNNGTSFCPYRLFERAGLIRTLEEIGYSLRDEWRVAELSCHIPFYPEFAVSDYSGYYFVRR